MSGTIGSKRVGTSTVDIRRDIEPKEAFTLGQGKAAGAATPPSSVNGLESVGSRLSDLRRQSGLTQIEVAFRMGTTQPTLARLEKGEAKPNLRTLSRYADAIGQKVKVEFSGSEIDAVMPASERSSGLEEIPSSLARLRKQLGITQSSVATRMETTQPVIARLEAGDGVPNLRTLERYSEAIGTKMTITFEAAAKRD